MRPMGRSWIRLGAVALLGMVTVSAGGCTAFEIEGSLGVYERSASVDPMGYRVASVGSSGWSRIGDGVGCTAVGLPWTISIGPAGADGAVGEQRPLLSSADVDNPHDAVIWIDVAEDGSVTWGEGMPDWTDEAAPTCGNQ